MQAQSHPVMSRMCKWQVHWIVCSYRRTLGGPSVHLCAQVALLTALSQVIAQLPAVPEAALQQALMLADRIAATYGALWPVQRPPVHAAFAALLGALAPDQAALRGALPRLVSLLLAHTLRPAEVSTGSLSGSITAPLSLMHCMCYGALPLALTRVWITLFAFPGDKQRKSICCVQAAQQRQPKQPPATRTAPGARTCPSGRRWCAAALRPIKTWPARMQRSSSSRGCLFGRRRCTMRWCQRASTRCAASTLHIRTRLKCSRLLGLIRLR